MRVVFDTNILVSALALPGGRADAAMRRVIDGRDSLVLSRPILDELLGVLARKFARDREQLARTALLLSELAEFVRPDETLAVLDDEPDNRILECGVAGQAEAIVTGDAALLALGHYANIELLSLSDYLERAP